MEEKDPQVSVVSMNDDLPELVDIDDLPINPAGARAKSSMDEDELAFDSAELRDSDEFELVIEDPVDLEQAQEADASLEDVKPSQVDEAAQDEAEEEVQLAFIDDDEEVIAVSADGIIDEEFGSQSGAHLSDSGVDDIDDFDVEFLEEDSEEVLALQAEKEQLEADLLGLNKRMMRIAADYENFKRRSERERRETTRFANEGLLGDFLPVMDNLERALNHAQDATNPESLREGVEMVRRQFEKVLQKHACISFESSGEPFDPQRHEAISQLESADHPANTVLEEFHKGYHLHDRLLRPALVVVSKKPAATNDEE